MSTEQRDSLRTPIRGDAYSRSTVGSPVVNIDALLAEGVRVRDNDGRQATISWSSWPEYASGLQTIYTTTDSCPNWATGSHVGKLVFISSVRRCNNRYRCLACGRTFDVDSSD